MGSFHREIAQRRWRLAAWLVVAGVLLRALIPVGYMINTEAGAPGEPVLVLCPTGLSEPVRAHLGDPSPAPSGHETFDAPCAFAAAAALSAFLAGLGLALALDQSLRGRVAPRGTLLRGNRLRIADGARAPPVSA